MGDFRFWPTGKRGLAQKPRARPSQHHQSSISTQAETATFARRHRPDYGILILTSLLLVIGLIVVYSISPALSAMRNISQGSFVIKQIIDVSLAAAAFFIASSIPISIWQKLARPLVMVAIIGSLVVLITPVDLVYPAHRWIRLGGFSFQIVELIKLALVLWLAQFLTERARAGKLASFKDTLRPLLIILVAVGVVIAMAQSDLGSAGVIVAIMGFMAFTIGIPLKKIALITVGILILLVLSISTSGYRRDRLSTFLHPGQNCQDTSYQACQALISVGSGGLFGLGLGYGVQAYGYQPQASNDSIFAIIAEKFGFIGTTMVLAIYGLFISKLKNVIKRTTDLFSRLVVVGILAWISTQMIINVGGMIGLLPLKGITLPLISQGGTSMVFLTVALGIVFQISRYTSYNVTQSKYSPSNFEENNHSGSNRRRIRRSYNAPTANRPRT